MNPFYPPLNDAYLDAVAASDLCLEEKLGRHLAALFGREMPFIWVSMAAHLIWAEDNDVQPNLPFEVPGFEAFSRDEPLTRSEQMVSNGLYRYLGQNLIPVKDFYAGRPVDFIPKSKASLDQKLHWHRHLFRGSKMPVEAVDTMRQAIYLDAYGFDLDSTMIPLQGTMTYLGKKEITVRAAIEEFHLTAYLLETDDKAARDAAPHSASAGSVLAGQWIEDLM